MPYRVLMITEASWTGVGRHTLDLTEGLIAAGCEVHLIYSPIRIDETFRARLAANPAIRACPLPMRTGPHPSDVRVVRAVRSYLRQHGPFHIVHGHSSKGGAIARLAGVRSGARTVYTPNGFVTANPKLSRLAAFFYGGCEAVLAQLGDAVVAVADEEREVIVASGVPRRTVRVIPNCIDPPDFLPREAARRRLKLPIDVPVVGFVGRLGSQKNPLLLVEAFAHVHAQHPQVLLALIGDGPEAEAVRKRIAELGLQQVVRLLGQQPAADLMRAFDVFALPSRYEGMPYVLLEALNAGVPIVSTEVSSCRSLVHNGATGFVVEQATPEAFAAALAALVEDEARRADFGRRARTLAAQFTLREMIARTLSLYGDLIATPLPAASTL